MELAGAGKAFSFWFSGVFFNPLLARSSNFVHAVHQLSDGEKNYIVYVFFAYSLLSLLLLVVLVFYFVVLLNYLYLNTRVSHFINFSSPPLWGGMGGVSKRLLGPKCWLPG